MIGKFVVVTGPSASGKSTLVRALIKELPGAVRLVTVTTRAPRKGERDGVDYHFVTREEFSRRVAEGEFFEYEEVYGNLYGSSMKILDMQSQGHPYVFAVIDVKGAKTLKEKVSGSIAIFVRPGTIEDTVRRLRNERSGEPEAELKKRIEHATHELLLAGEFDHVIDNADGAFEKTLAEALSIISAPKPR